MSDFQFSSVSSDRYSPADHLGVPTIFSSRGETREMEDKYADEPGTKKDVAVMEMVAVLGADGKAEAVFTDALVWQTFGYRFSRKPGVYLCVVRKTGQRYVLDDATPSQQKAAHQWLQENCKDDGGVAVYTGPANPPSYDEEPF